MLTQTDIARMQRTQGRGALVFISTLAVMAGLVFIIAGINLYRMWKIIDLTGVSPATFFGVGLNLDKMYRGFFLYVQLRLFAGIVEILGGLFLTYAAVQGFVARGRNRRILEDFGKAGK